MISTIEVVKAAPEVSLVTLDEAKTSLRITDETSDDLIELIVRDCSSAVAALCNRVLVKETVVETFREIGSDASLFLSRFPVKAADITSVNVGDVEWTINADYELDSATGRLVALAGVWSEPTVVSYAGGYEVPQGVPPALRQAVMLFGREAYYASLRGDSSVRMIAHKESRIIFFDPNVANRSGSSGGGGGSAAMAGTATMRAAKDLLSKYTRYAI